MVSHYKGRTALPFVGWLYLLLLLCSSSDSPSCEAGLSVPLILEQMFPCLCRCVLGEVPDYMECSCYNVLGGSSKIKGTDRPASQPGLSGIR